MNAIEIIETLYYVYWVLILLSPIVFGVTVYFFLKKKSTPRKRKTLLIASIFLMLLDAYQFIGFAYQKKRWEEMEKVEAVQ